MLWNLCLTFFMATPMLDNSMTTASAPQSLTELQYSITSSIQLSVTFCAGLGCQPPPRLSCSFPELYFNCTTSNKPFVAQQREARAGWMKSCEQNLLSFVSVLQKHKRKQIRTVVTPKLTTTRVDDWLAHSDTHRNAPNKEYGAWTVTLLTKGKISVILFDCISRLSWLSSYQ